MADPVNTIPIDGDDTEVVDEGNRSILMGIISQLSKGGDLHRVTLPTFVLEPRSMLERITDFMSHPDIIIKYACCRARIIHLTFCAPEGHWTLERSGSRTILKRRG